MKRLVYRIFKELGETDIAINVANIKQPPIAGAIGANLGGLLFLHVSGTIYIDINFLQSNGFANKEILFILAHESAHIFRNHSISTLSNSTVILPGLLYH
jgi:Zn-dependent protease with chaperone function